VEALELLHRRKPEPVQVSDERELSRRELLEKIGDVGLRDTRARLHSEPPVARRVVGVRAADFRLGLAFDA
jgi:hypothetical protein